MKATHCVGLLSLILTSFVSLAGQKNSAHEARKNAFTSTDGTFHFEYPATLVRCERNPNQLDRWRPDKACEAFTPICSDFSGQSEGTVTCIAYPAEEMKGTNFQAAAFSVSELKAATTQAECVKVEDPPPHVGTARKETVNGVTFTVIETDGVATGNLIHGYAYRSFHGDKCYELDVRIAFSNPAYADPGIMKNFDLEAVRKRLKQVLDMFQFVK
jgi:hypothetical protein